MNQSELRLAFAGTSQLAATVLEVLLQQPGMVMTCVFTVPDKATGRGRKIKASPVKSLSLESKLPVIQPENAGDMDINILKDLDCLIVTAYGLIIPEKVLNAPKFGCVNIHTSLLPRWRGAAPIQRAIEAGDEETGISIMKMDPGLDTGPILAQSRCPIDPDDTTASLGQKLALLGAKCLIDTLEKLVQGDIKPVPQDDGRATYAHKISKEEGEIDWQKPAVELERKIRAYNPHPVAYTELNGYTFRIWQARIIDCVAKGSPGKIIACNKHGIDVATSEGVLRLLLIQPPGKKPMSVGDFLNGRPDFSLKCAS